MKNSALMKPILRGHFHQAAFFLAIGACIMLVVQSRDAYTAFALSIYSLSLITMFGISALYHRCNWQEKARMWLRRLDHSAIFILIAGTGTPISLLSLPADVGGKVLVMIWVAALAGILQSLVWVHAPKWVSAILYLTVGWLVVPYLPQFRVALGGARVGLLMAGGVVYTLGALVYAMKKPNPCPRVFGYHEIFHILVIVAAGLHFAVIAGLVS